MSEIPPEDNEQNPFAKRGFVISAALILALAAAVIVLIVLPSDNSEPNAGKTSTPEETTSAPATQADTEESICGLPGNDNTALGAAPESDWELVGKVAVPASPEQYGPGTSENDIRSCFSRTPTGALYAAANIFGLVTSGQQRTVLEELSADSPARTQQLESPGRESPSATPAQIKGFQVQNYTDNAATVDLGIELDNGAVGSVPIPLVWDQGDWKLNVTEGGISGSQQLNDLTAYISWSGV